MAFPAPADTTVSNETRPLVDVEIEETLPDSRLVAAFQVQPPLTLVGVPRPALSVTPKPVVFDQVPTFVEPRRVTCSLWPFRTVPL